MSTEQTTDTEMSDRPTPETRRVRYDLALWLNGDPDSLSVETKTALEHAERLERERDELLEALKAVTALYDSDEGCRSLPEYVAARAAIAKAEGGAE